MDLGFRDQVAVITASSKGLGKAIAEQLAREGANVVVCGRDAYTINKFAENLEQQFQVKTLGVQADLSNPDSVKRLVERTVDTFGKVDALVCNSGGPPGGSFLSLEDDKWEDAFQSNLMSVVRLVRGFHPHMNSNGARIATIASSSVKIPIPGLVLSNTFRTAISGLMKTLSIELGSQGILLNTLCPGRIHTDRIKELDGLRAEREGVSIEQIQSIAMKDIPLGRYGDPQEFAVFAAFLLSPMNTYITGSTFYVDGGMVKAL